MFRFLIFQIASSFSQRSLCSETRPGGHNWTVMQHSSGSGELSRTFKGTLALVAFGLLQDKSAECLSLETSMALPPPLFPLAFHRSTFPLGSLGRVWDPRTEMDHILLMCFSPNHPGIKTILILSDLSKLCLSILFSQIQTPMKTVFITNVSVCI